ncbi:MAG TPA: alanine--tRNA ligase, partial [Tepidisphaeraceae bacterium]|nr:alanine--tRNA ligase [Tepidisphaeraceae bacterium]
RDLEAAELWKEIAGLPDNHIHFFGKDNFWEMGDTGPCGPCSEIYIDRTPDKTGGPEVNGNDPRVMEFWNLVFIQYNRNADRSLTPLPARHVDTGMGFERICSILQDKNDMYAIDLFDPFFAALTELTGFKYAGKFPQTNAADSAAEAADEQLRHDIAFRVIADHIRTLTFALTDGAVPSNEGRGYVLRRILRRAVRFGRQQLGLREPFLHKLVSVVVEAMGNAFPELRKNPDRVVQLILDEEISFGKTLDRGIELFEEAANRAKSKLISAEDAFKLHDTYGFPIDLTRIMAEERGISVDIEGYEKLMEQARELARAGGREDVSKLTDLPPNVLAELAASRVNPTDDRAKYSPEEISAHVMAIWDGSDLGLSPANVEQDEEIAIILDRTNFYAEMGGQIGDSGAIHVITNQTGTFFRVADTQIVGGYVLHIGRLEKGSLKVGDAVRAIVPRTTILQNHTATHLANWALREVLGEGVQQKGSLVDRLKLRFDFSHAKSLTDEEVARVEQLVNESIGRGMDVFADEVPQEQALKINGLRAVFGEKYPPLVRVVSVGVPVKVLLSNPGDAKWRNFSIEFCGGTHLNNSREAGEFVIASEESVSKGVRRIVALTGSFAHESIDRGKLLQSEIKRFEALEDATLPAAIKALQIDLIDEKLPLLARRFGQRALAALQDRHRKWEKSQKSAGAAIDVASIASELLKNGNVVVSSI